MDWFKKNPFFGGLLILTALAVAGAVYFIFSASSEFTVQQDDYATQSSALRRIQDAKPFPDKAAAQLAESESAQAAAVLADLEAAVAGQTAAVDISLTPQGFQDKLSSAASALEKKAGEREVSLPEDFYLGFEQYRAQPPPGAAAPLLGQQLESINEVVSLLIDAGVKSLVSLSRPPLASEGGAAQSEESNEDANKPQMVLAPFDIEFISEQSNFREALAAIISAEPLVVVKLLAVANSQPAPPPKQAPGTEPTTAVAAPEGAEQIPVLFGQETVTVKMRLAALSGAPTNEQK